VSQPWGTIRSCVVNVITPRKPIAIAGAVSGTTAGWRFADVGSAPVIGRKLFAAPRRRDPFPNHGGLTVAAPVERAFVHRECRYFSANRGRAPGAAGVSQPWCTIRSCAVNVITPRKPIAIAGAIPEPRRADARRCCKQAFVYRTSRSFAGKCLHRRTTKSGGRKPPVDSLPRLHRGS
jgi:hypothetical protein